MSYEVPHLIDGKKTLSKGRTLTIYNPASGEHIGHLAVADHALINQAISAAKNAYPAWAKTPPAQRAKILFRFKALLDEHIDELAEIVTREHGKTLAEAKGSVQRGIDVVDYACGIPNLLKGEYALDVAKEMDAYSLHQPLGVCVGITPFNFPAMIPLWMFSSAIACGNTFILKPSEKDPSCAIKLVELAHAAGVPQGVVNVLQGDKETVEFLITHPDVKAVSFVGSTPVAEHVYKTATTHLKRVQAFAGAKNHCIVMPDADMTEAADAITAAAFGSAGERCMAISVVLAVGNEIADQLIAQIKIKMSQLKIGAGTEKNIDMGPLITEQHWQRVQSYIALGKNEGASLIVDHSQYKPKDHEQGYFMGACLFDHVKPSMQIYREEIFGPVLCIVRVNDFNSALTLINDHEYGNGTAIFTRDGYTAKQFADRVEVGMVGINVPVPVPVAYHSFGGWKRSIFADIGMYGPESIRFYTKLKTVTSKWFPKDVK